MTADRAEADRAEADHMDAEDFLDLSASAFEYNSRRERSNAKAGTTKSMTIILFCLDFVKC